MKSKLPIIVSAGIGASLMYFLDPERGQRRRAQARDQARASTLKLQNAISKTAKDTGKRARGLVEQARVWFALANVSDDVLAARIKAALERAINHASAIGVMAQNGRVRLTGPVLADEVIEVLSCMWSVPGVKTVDNEMEVHAEAGSIPGLQGAARSGNGRTELMSTTWSPAARLITGIAGGGSVLYGITRRGIVGTIAALGGAALLARAVTNTGLRRLTGIGAGRRAINIQKTLHINAPVEHVFERWTHYEQFPEFMNNIQSVRPLDGVGAQKRWHWSVIGPANKTIEFDSVVTTYQPNQLLAWRTEPGSLVQHAGVVRFKSNPDRTTDVHIKMAYNPGLGELGHVVAKIAGSDPKRLLDEDLTRMKHFIETGVRPSDSAAPSPRAF